MSNKRDAPDEPEPPLSARREFRRDAARLTAAELVDFLASDPSDKRLLELLKEYRGREDDLAAALQALARRLDVYKYLRLCDRLPPDDQYDKAHTKCVQILYDKLNQLLGQGLPLVDLEQEDNRMVRDQLRRAIAKLEKQPHTLQEWTEIYYAASQLDDIPLQKLAIQGLE